MPLTGSDFTPDQLQRIRLIADYVNPGMSDGQVLAWLNQRAVEGAMRAARDAYVRKVFEVTDDMRRVLLSKVADPE